MPPWSTPARAQLQRDGRCFRFVYDEQGKPPHCLEPIVPTRSTKLDRLYQMDPCAEHSWQLQGRGRSAQHRVDSVASWP